MELDSLVRCGEIRVLRIDGSVEEYSTQIDFNEKRATISRVQKLIDCSLLDTVILHVDKMQIMLVDDTGMIDGKPVNPRATELYHQRYNTPHCIHGDVAIVNDEDFE